MCLTTSRSFTIANAYTRSMATARQRKLKQKPFTKCLPNPGKLTKAFVRLRRPSYFLFAWPKRKITKEKGHPAWRLPPIHGRQVREPGPGFSPGHPALAKRHRHPCRCPLRGLSSPPHRRTGAPGRAAGHPGPHSIRNRSAVARAKGKQRRTIIRVGRKSAIGQERSYRLGLAKAKSGHSRHLT